MSKEAMKLAREALRKARRKILTTEECHATITFLNKALAKQEQGEPVAWPKLSSDMEYAAQDEFHILPPRMKRLWKRMESLYTTPQQRTWVGLTDEEKQQCIYDKQGFVLDYEDVVDAVETKLKEKNGA